MRNIVATVTAVLCLFGILGDGTPSTDSSPKNRQSAESPELKAEIVANVPAEADKPESVSETAKPDEVEQARQNDPLFRALMKEFPNLGGLHSDVLNLPPASLPEKKTAHPAPPVRKSGEPAVGESAAPPRDELVRATHFDTFLRLELGRVDRKIWNILHNISHGNTFGYKAFRFEFPESLPRFSLDSERITLPEASGTVPILVDMSRGKIVETREMLDIAIEGDGFLKADNSRNNEAMFTRCGRLTLDPNGCLAFATPYQSLNSQSYSEPLEPQIVIPEGTVSIQIAQKGTVWAKDASGNQSECGVIQLVYFAKPERLRPIDERFFEATVDSGDPIELTRDAKNFPVIRQGCLEAANVDSEAQKAELERLLEQRTALRKLVLP